MFNKYKNLIKIQDEVIEELEKKINTKTRAYDNLEKRYLKLEVINQKNLKKIKELEEQVKIKDE